MHAGNLGPPGFRLSARPGTNSVLKPHVCAFVQSSREELLEDIEELKKKVTGATEKIE